MGTQFSDSQGRAWTLRLTLGHRNGLKALGVDTANFHTALDTITRLTAFDADRLVAVCRLLTVEPVPDDYADAWDGGTIDAAAEALADAVTDFYLSRSPAAAKAAKVKRREVWADLDQKAVTAVTRSDSGTRSPDSSAG